MSHLMKILCLLPVFLCCSVGAQVSHLSLNQRQFELGGYPKLRLNLVAEPRDLSRLEFLLRQGEAQERLMVQPLGRFMLQLFGVEDVTSAAAQLVVRQYRGDSWHEIASLALFDASGSSHSPGGASTGEACRLEVDVGDTLWRIARRYTGPWHTHVYGAMLAIYEANRQAFVGQKIDALRRDASLICPGKDSLAAQGDEAGARLRFEALQAGT
ncbi:hypothetical protein [Shewanella salipaludis]|uniref:LysM domain-containing protein n=1 Tax=Shewanella salipaludis TaxID=2723052 RepID=A0A972FT28_9GAMM|nr:hypothetical protein [Shewanella salipaludis]NMH65202.1 hypothetical protein [Shewanella salipaludis]